MPPAVDDAYDLLPYTDHAYAEAHPDRLAVVARLSGWAAPAVEGARVLELGCGRGGNLLPMASALPGATFVGVDRSARQIGEARALAREAGLGNVTLHAASFDDAPLAGAFDYVLCHGVVSWVPVATRRALFRTIARVLAPGGVAHASFNVLPGWYERLAARDWLRFAAAQALATGDAADTLSWLRARVPPERACYAQGLASVQARAQETEAAYVAHEYLADEHHPELVGRVLAEAEEAGLAYLGDAIPQATAFELLDDETVLRAEKLDVSGAQQLVDFVTGASFRRALFVRADAAAARGWRWPRQLDASAITGLRLASRLVPEAARDDAAAIERFRFGDLTVEIADAGARRALHALAQVAPASLGWDELTQAAGGDAPALEAELFDAWLATGALDLHAFAPTLATFPSPLPRACPVARMRATRGGPLTSAWHHEVVLPSKLTLDVLALADGTRTDERIAAALALHQLSPAERLATVRASLVLLASFGLLVA
jgi:SAM-dependent methyltransferase